MDGEGEGVGFGMPGCSLGNESRTCGGAVLGLFLLVVT